MNDNEIIKALECCLKMENCGFCPLYSKDTDIKECTTQLSKNALDLINRLQKENDDLFFKLQGVMWSVDKWLEGDELKQDEVNRAITMREKTLQITEKQQAEIERLNIRNKALTDMTKNYDWKFAKAKSEARKEIAEMIIREYPEADYFISNLLKEMEGEE